MAWHQCIGLPPRWSELKHRLDTTNGESDLVVQITDNCDGETTVYWHEQDNALATWTPGRNVVLSRMRADQAVSLASYLSQQSLQGVSGHLPEIEAFADHWVNGVEGRSRRLDQTLILYDLPELITPPPCPGGIQACSRADLDHVYRWILDFHKETDPKTPRPRQATVDLSLARGSYWYWTVDNQPVSLVGLRWITAENSRIAPVYTPPDKRRHGYASALVYEVAKYALDAGRCTLFADQAYPASNSVYQALGFRPGPVFQLWEFTERSD